MTLSGSELLEIRQNASTAEELPLRQFRGFKRHTNHQVRMDLLRQVLLSRLLIVRMTILNLPGALIRQDGSQKPYQYVYLL